MTLQIGIGGKTGAAAITADHDEQGLTLSVRDPAKTAFMAGSDARGLHLSAGAGGNPLHVWCLVNTPDYSGTLRGDITLWPLTGETPGDAICEDLYWVWGFPDVLNRISDSYNLGGSSGTGFGPLAAGAYLMQVKWWSYNVGGQWSYNALQTVDFDVPLASGYWYEIPAFDRRTTQTAPEW
jgi:hypothetical protein